MKRFIFLIIALLAFIFISCTGFFNPIENLLYGQPIPRPEIPLNTYVYAVGQSGSDAVYWRNEDFFVLPRVGVGATGEIATSIAVSNNVVYIAGQILYSASSFEAVYWRNGQPVNLPRGNARISEATAITVFDNDVYITGRADDDAVYWRNNQIVILPRGEAERAVATSMAVLGRDIYVAGYLVYRDITQAVYWRSDGQPVTLSHGGIAQSITISGNNVYVAGRVGNNAVLWTNGRPSNLPNPRNNHRSATSDFDGRPSIANSVFTSGNDVYVAGRVQVMVGSPGSIEYWGALWKNGERIIIMNLIDPGRLSTAGYNGAGVNSIYILDNNVYLGGYFINNNNTGNNRAAVWINGVLSYTLDDPRERRASTIIRDIFVVKR